MPGLVCLSLTSTVKIVTVISARLDSDIESVQLTCDACLQLMSMWNWRATSMAIRKNRYMTVHSK